MHIYINTHKQCQNSPTKIKYSRVTRQTKEIKKFYLPVKNKTNESTYCKAELKQGCQVGNKAMKTKLTNMLRGKERKKE